MLASGKMDLLAVGETMVIVTPTTSRRRGGYVPRRDGAGRPDGDLLQARRRRAIQSAADLDALRAVAAAGAERDLRVGAGTVLDPGQLPSIREAGAAYTASPGTDDDVIRASLDAGLPTLPGVASASEIQRCRRFGLTWLKAFPAQTLGPRWIRAMHGPFPEAVFVSTGGVSSANAEELLSAGTRVVAFGSVLENPAELAHMSRLAACPA